MQLAPKTVTPHTRIGNGTAEFVMSDAKVGTGTSAATANLTAGTAEDLPKQKDVVIEKASFSVTFEKYNHEDISQHQNKGMVEVR